VGSHVTVDRLQFALTVTFHYLFPILTMGVALFIAWLKTVSYLGGERRGLWLLRKTARRARVLRRGSALLGEDLRGERRRRRRHGDPARVPVGTNGARFSDFAGGVIGGSCWP
jgi:cytochrome bd ubiquinol oxidase subunit I